MQKSIKELKGSFIIATDGDIGTLEDCYFDDKFWTIRYLVAGTGDWFVGKDVLLSPFALGKADVASGRIHAKVTRKQADSSPNIDADKPVSSQHETSYCDYYGYPYYWSGPNLWGSAHYPNLPDVDQEQVEERRATRKEGGDFHLRSAAKVTGHHIEAADGEIGHVEDFIIDDETWEIRYMVVDTHNWLPGKKVLVAPLWIERVSWENSKIYVSLSREAIKSGPEYHVDALNREYEDKLHDHYNRPKYWDSPVGQREIFFEPVY
jgi:sporulation protein YlmC with PRC-barrel domain